MSEDKALNWTEALTDEQKQEVWDFIVFTVKEIRNEIANDIQATSNLWKHKGLNKSRRTQKAFDISAAIARGQHETGMAQDVHSK